MSTPYQISSQETEQIIAQLNQILADVDSRLSRMEGNRGTATINNRLDLVDDDQNRISGFTNEAL